MFWSSFETELTHIILNVEQSGKEQYKGFKGTRINESNGKNYEPITHSSVEVRPGNKKDKKMLKSIDIFWENFLLINLNQGRQ